MSDKIMVVAGETVVLKKGTCGKNPKCCFFNDNYYTSKEHYCKLYMSNEPALKHIYVKCKDTHSMHFEKMEGGV